VAKSFKNDQWGIFIALFVSIMNGNSSSNRMVKWPAIIPRTSDKGISLLAKIETIVSINGIRGAGKLKIPRKFIMALGFFLDQI
jgi:hypothetical protein